MNDCAAEGTTFSSTGPLRPAPLASQVSASAAVGANAYLSSSWDKVSQPAEAPAAPVSTTNSSQRDSVEAKSKSGGSSLRSLSSLAGVQRGVGESSSTSASASASGGAPPGRYASNPAQLQPSRSGNSTPFATQATLEQELSDFDSLEKSLTGLMAEKTSLEEELSKLYQRGGKTLKERTRIVQVGIKFVTISH